MNHAQTPLQVAQELSGLIHAARRAVALSANLALQLTTVPGPYRSVPAPIVADALSLLVEQLEDAETAVVVLEDMLQEPAPEAAPRDPTMAEAHEDLVDAIRATRVPLETVLAAILASRPTAESLVAAARDRLRHPPFPTAQAAPLGGPAGAADQPPQAQAPIQAAPGQGPAASAGQ